MSLPDDGYIVIYPAEIGIDPASYDPAVHDRLARMLGSADRIVVSCAKDWRVTCASALKGANVPSESFRADGACPLGIADHDGTPAILVADGLLGLTEQSLKQVRIGRETKTFCVLLHRNAF
ncbi:hypothetical protein [Sphingomonas sp. Leaf17]|uniref:hypothetical protein n=1 Tax=Sphingomonas sp. Leaf17 TaxID=1735683 RepID=UPI0012E24F7D|nr:hypothetical protein [Sphingomonas sp. Leaf17]